MKRRTWLGLLALCACSGGGAHTTTTAAPAPATAPAPAHEAAAVPLAVTLDDLPYVGALKRGDSAARALERIAAALTREQAPAMGFVTCSRLQGDDLRPWLAAELPVANHSTAHQSLDELGHDAFVADVRACRDQLQAITGSAPRYFRYPFLQTGATRALRDQTSASIAALGHRRAPVSIDTSDWALADAYAQAHDAGDDARAAAIADAYLAHVQRAARRYRRVARQRAGREVSQILLLHANSLAADHLGRVLDMLRREGFRFVSLDEALEDEVYARADDWVDPVGASWLLRVAPADREGWAWDRGQLVGMQVRFGLRDDDHGRIGPLLRARKLGALPAWMITHTEPVAANSLVFQTADGSTILADTPMTPSATEDLLDWMAARFGKMPALATVSHFHLDAAAGIGPLQAAGVPIAVSDKTAAMLRERGAASQASMAELFGDVFRGWQVAAPSQTFPIDSGYATTVGGTKVQVVYPGAAHAPDNVVTWFPESGVMFGGCMVKGGDDLGYLGDADLQSWPEAMLRLEAMQPKLVIPGHGERTDPEQLSHTRVLLERR